MSPQMEWLDRSPAGRASHCDRCRQVVRTVEPRLRVYDRRGPDRARGKGSKASYLCVECASRHYGRTPPAKQEGLFE